MRQLTLVAIVVCSLLPLALQAQMVRSSVTVEADGPDQMPVIYVHGWRDDGATWGRGLRGACDDPSTQLEPSGTALFGAAGIPSWAVQWWAGTEGDPFATSDEGYAFLSDQQTLEKDSVWTDADGTYAAHDLPCPSALDWLSVNPVEAPRLFVRDNYNTSGRVADHAQDLLDLLRYARAAGKLQAWRQVNLITHSKGSLVARAMLDLADQSGRADAEYVSNVVYNAPPFAGSSVAPLAQRLFDLPAAQLGLLFGDPWFVNAVAALGNATVGSAMRWLFDRILLLAELPGGLASLSASHVLDRLLDVLGLLELPAFSLDVSFSWDAFLQTPVGAVAVEGVRLFRDLMEGLMGFPAQPALGDLHPAQLQITQWTNTDNAAQWLTYGHRYPGATIFPCAGANNVPTPCADAIAADPTLVGDPAGQVMTRSDGVVSLFSARLLADTDAFGPRYRVLADKPLAHGDLGASTERMGDEWLKVFLSPITDLVLEGAVQVASSSQRHYIVSADSTLSFSSREVVARTAPHWQIMPGGARAPLANLRTARAAAHAWRLVRPATGVTPWQRSVPGERVDMAFVASVADTAFGGHDLPLRLEWRALNEAGGREMIRSAWTSIAPKAPHVVSRTLIGPGSEIHELRPSLRLGANAVRQSFFQGSSSPLLQPIVRSPEAQWLISNPATKALAVVLSHRGDVRWAWDDETLAGGTLQTNVSALFVTLDGLTPGRHDLWFETSNAVGQASPRQRVGFVVDDEPPVIGFVYTSDHSLGYVVGPTTPLLFEVHDVGGVGGSGAITVPGHPDSPLPSGRTFNLGDTNLAQLGKAAGQVGGVLTLNATATDRVGNSAAEAIELYYDWTPPDLSVREVVGALATGPGRYRTFSQTVEIVLDLTDSASGFTPPQGRLLTTYGTARIIAPFVPGDTVGQPAGTWVGRVELVPGQTTAQLHAADLAGNVGELSLHFDFQPGPFDTEPIELLSHRLAPDACYDSGGVSKLCAPGVIDNLQSDFGGEVVAFDSAGERFIFGDNNNKKDIFVWRAGPIVRASEGPDGEQGNNHSDRPAVSGNGRYVYFRSRATNLVAASSGLNLYVKDLDTGRLAVISRAADGTPANVGGVTSFFHTATTFSGRYVFYHSRGNNHVAGLVDTNNQEDVFMVDLDPDQDGDYFGDNYLTFAITLGAPGQTANGASTVPSVSLDGSALALRTRANDLHPDLASATGANAVLFVFSGSDAGGDLDVGSPTVVPISTRVANGSTFVDDALHPRVAPFGTAVVFATRQNIVGTGDTNNQALGLDVYLSEAVGGDPTNRAIRWVSQANGPGGPQSGTQAALFPSVAVSADPSVAGGHKVGWVSVQDNMEPGDSNGVADLWIRRDSPVFPAGLPAPAWISGTLPSGEAVNVAELSPDGRFAFFATRQSYVSPYGRIAISLYRRRIEPAYTTRLTLQVVGAGSVARVPEGAPNGAGFDYADDAVVTLTPTADTGWYFSRFEGVDAQASGSALLRTSLDRTVRVIFVQGQPPRDATAQIFTQEDRPSIPTAPDFTDPDATDNHRLRIETPPAHGRARVDAGRLVYVPEPDFNGSDSFTFQVVDSTGLELAAPASANVTVQPVNDPPTFATASIVTTQDTPSALIAPSVTDVDLGDVFTLTIVDGAIDGTATVENGALRYVPNGGFVGEDAFSFEVTDSGGASVIGIASVTVREGGTPDGGPGDAGASDGGPGLQPQGEGCGCTHSGPPGGGGPGLLGLLVVLGVLVVRLRRRPPGSP